MGGLAAASTRQSQPPPPPPPLSSSSTDHSNYTDTSRLIEKAEKAKIRRSVSENKKDLMLTSDECINISGGYADEDAGENNDQDMDEYYDYLIRPRHVNKSSASSSYVKSSSAMELKRKLSCNKEATATRFGYLNLSIVFINMAFSFY